MRVQSTSAVLYHNSTHSSVWLSQIRSKYYANKQDLDQLLRRGLGEVGEGIDLELELDDEEITPLIDLIDIRHS